MARQRKYTDEQLVNAIKNSGSIRQVLQRIGLVPAGGNYETVHRKIRELSLDTSHFHGQGWNIGGKFKPNPPKSMGEILTVNSVFRSSLLHHRLIDEGYKIHKCESCGRKTWLKNKIPLELHHINGDKYDNRIENLQLLCANCHALTPYYRKRKCRDGGIRNTHDN